MSFISIARDQMSNLIETNGWYTVQQEEFLSFVVINKITYLCENFFNNNYFMKKGKVKFFNNAKGFGFIKDNETEEEYFVHVSGLIDEIAEGDDVTFELTEGKKGLNAVNVKKDSPE